MYRADSHILPQFDLGLPQPEGLNHYLVYNAAQQLIIKDLVSLAAKNFGQWFEDNWADENSPELLRVNLTDDVSEDDLICRLVAQTIANNLGEVLAWEEMAEVLRNSKSLSMNVMRIMAGENLALETVSKTLLFIPIYTRLCG